MIKLWLKISRNRRRKQISRERKYRVPKKMNTKRPTPRCSITEMAKVKDKEKILKAAREKQSYTREPS